MLLRRAFSFRAADAQPSENGDLVVDVAVSSEAPVDRWGRYQEVLAHDSAAVVMIARSVLFNHDPNQLLGGIQQTSLTSDKTARARMTISKDAVLPTGIKAVDAIRQDMLQGVSIGYSIENYQKTETDGIVTVRATNWTLREVSFTPIPADPSVGIGRSSTEDEAAFLAAYALTRANPQAPAMSLPATPAATTGAPATQVSEELASTRAELDVLKRESHLRTVADSHGIDLKGLDLRSFKTTEEGLTALLGRKSAPAAPAHAVAPVQVLVDGADKTRAALMDGLQARAGQPDPKSGDLGMRRMTALEMARRAAMASGHPEAFNWGTDDLVDYSLRRGKFLGRAYAPSDFPNVLANTFQKFALNGFNQNISTWRQWTRIRPVNDFKAASMGAVACGLFGQIDAPGLPLPPLNMAESGASLQAKMGGAVTIITRETLQNDDLGEIARNLMLIGTSADMTIEFHAVRTLLGMTWTGAITTGADLTPTGAAPEAALGKAVGDFLSKADPSGKPMSVMPAFALVTPTMLVNASKALVQSTASPDFKPLAGRMQPIVVPYLASTTVHANASADNFYVAANPQMVDGIVVALVDEQPRLIEIDTAGVAGIGYRIEFPWGISTAGTFGLQKATKA